MKRTLVKRMAWVLFGIFLLLTAIATVTRSDALFNAAIVALIGMAVVELVLDRCPHCRAYLGRTGARYCPQCGQPLEE